MPGEQYHSQLQQFQLAISSPFTVGRDASFEDAMIVGESLSEVTPTLLTVGDVSKRDAAEDWSRAFELGSRLGASCFGINLRGGYFEGSEKKKLPC